MGYVRLDPTVSEFRFQLYDITGADVPDVSHYALVLTLSRKGCDTACAEFRGYLEADNTVVVPIPEGALRAFKRGYYTGCLMVGCEETCPMDFIIGPDLCTKPVLTRDVDRPNTLNCTPVCNPCSDGQHIMQSDYKVIADDGANVTLRYYTKCVELPDPCATT